MKRVETDRAPKAAGHYSQAIIQGGFVFVSRQLPIDPATGEKKMGTIEEQAQQTLENVAAIVKAAGSDLSRVVKTTVYISAMELWGRVNEIYGKFFGEHRPARAVVPVKDLHFGFLIEIEAVACL